MNSDRHDTKKYSRAIVVVERCAGNSEVGEMWIETRSFPLDAPLKDVFDWANGRCEGRLMLTLDTAPDHREN